jgi:serine phosphatase RsbU (regulator of sigma subunit)
MVRLHVVPAEGQPFEEDYESDSLVIGRASSSDVPVLDRFLSRHHARLYQEGDDLWVEDLGSRNGTFVNGHRIDKPTRVLAGDFIGICKSIISIVEGPSSERRSGSSYPSEITTMYRVASDVLEASKRAISAIAEESEVRSAAERLRVLNEVHQDLSRSVSREEVLELILDHAFNHLQPETGALYLKKADGELYQAAGRTAEGAEEGAFFSKTLIQEVAEKGSAALVLDAQVDDRFAEAASIGASGVRSIVAAPLLQADEDVVLGMIVLTSRQNVRQFSQEDMELLVTLAAVAALRIRNVELSEQALERKRLENELAIAREIQLALLPEELPDLPGYEIHAGNIPSQMVSGDYYEVIERSSGRECVLMVADVCGKGIAASLLTAALEALCAAPIAAGLWPHQICERISALLNERTRPERFATAFMCLLEPASGILRYANAGHNPPLIIRSGEVHWLPGTGLPLGLLPDAQYEAVDTRLDEGDTLVVYTDGITEAANPNDEEFGDKRLADVCLQHAGASPGELAALIEAEVDAFMQGVPAADDRTLLIVRRKPGGEQAVPDGDGV